ncbi:hypothetical protein NFI96_034627 [Prochilodus magdalenae]|nr:hypothetical protein NFI96_034627 [Prochilodus magdalenae]
MVNTLKALRLTFFGGYQKGFVCKVHSYAYVATVTKHKGGDNLGLYCSRYLYILTASLFNALSFSLSGGLNCVFSSWYCGCV